MVRLVPDAPEITVSGLEAVLGNVLAEGLREPPWVAVADGSGAWLRLVATRPPRERCRGVVAALEPSALVCAARLGVGGAIRMPPSTPAAREALRAAAEMPLPPASEGDPAVLELAACRSDELWLVTFRDHGFWCRQLGERALAGLLARLCEHLPGLWAVAPWPCAVVASVERGQVEAAWSDLQQRADLAPWAIEIRSPEDRGSSFNATAAVYRALVTSDPIVSTAAATESRPVHRLPDGDRIGVWSTAELDPDGEEWVAFPDPDGGDTGLWRVRLSGRSDPLPEVLTPAAVEEAAEAAAVRVPGWLAHGLRPGTPAALLVSDVAESAAQRGLPLWIPNVDGAALRWVLGLPGTLWVDGPAVPE